MSGVIAIVRPIYVHIMSTLWPFYGRFMSYIYRCSFHCYLLSKTLVYTNELCCFEQ